jgi:hypothetical protein
MDYCEDRGSGNLFNNSLNHNWNEKEDGDKWNESVNDIWDNMGSSNEFNDDSCNDLSEKGDSNDSSNDSNGWFWPLSEQSDSTDTSKCFIDYFQNLEEIDEKKNFMEDLNEDILEPDMEVYNTQPNLEMEGINGKFIQDSEISMLNWRNLGVYENNSKLCFENQSLPQLYKKEVKNTSSRDIMSILSNKGLCRNPECLHYKEPPSEYCSSYCKVRVTNIRRKESHIKWNERLIKGRKMLLESAKTDIFEIKRKQLLEEFSDPDKEKLKARAKERKRRRLNLK